MAHGDRRVEDALRLSGPQPWRKRCRTFPGPRREADAQRVLTHPTVPVATSARGPRFAPDTALWQPVTAPRPPAHPGPSRPHPQELTLTDSTTGSLTSKLSAGAAGLIMLVVLLAAGAGAGVSSLLTGGDSIASGIAHDLIAASLLDYQQAASTCPGLPWTVLLIDR